VIGLRLVDQPKFGEFGHSVLKHGVNQVVSEVLFMVPGEVTEESNLILPVKHEEGVCSALPFAVTELCRHNKGEQGCRVEQSFGRLWRVFREFLANGLCIGSVMMGTCQSFALVSLKMALESRVHVLLFCSWKRVISVGSAGEECCGLSTFDTSWARAVQWLPDSNCPTVCPVSAEDEHDMPRI
jgi:hypothetical protein